MTYYVAVFMTRQGSNSPLLPEVDIQDANGRKMVPANTTYIEGPNGWTDGKATDGSLTTYLYGGTPDDRFIVHFNDGEAATSARFYRGTSSFKSYSPVGIRIYQAETNYGSSEASWPAASKVLDETYSGTTYGWTTTYDITPTMPSSTSVTVDVSTLTASSQAIEPTYVGISVPADIAVATAGASTSASEADVEAQFIHSATVSPTSDYLNNNTSGDTNPMHFTNSSHRAIFLMDLPDEVTPNGMRSVKFKVQFGTTSAAINSFALRTLTAPVAANGAPTAMSVGKVNIGKASGTYDITSIVDVNNFYGVVMVVDSGTTVSEQVFSVEEPNESYRPLLTVSYEIVAESDEVAVQTAVVNGMAYESTIGLGAVTDVSTALLDGAAHTAEVDVMFNPNVTTDVDTAQASASAPDATVAIPVVLDMTAGTASVEAYDVTSETTTNALVELDSPRILATHIGLTDVNGEPIVPTEGEDPYFNSTMFNDPTIWFRFNDIAGPPMPRVYDGSANLADRAGTLTSGVVIGLNTGPNGRKHYRFDGTGMFTQNETNSSSSEWASHNSTLEFSIRTTKRDQFIMYFDDDLYNEGSIQSSDMAPSELWLKDGRLELRRHEKRTSTSDFWDRVLYTHWTAFTDLADGKWHHIVLANEGDITGDVFSGPRLNVFVDGRFELRNYGPGFSFPDYIGGKPPVSRFGDNRIELQQSHWFEGDIAEVIYYREYTMSADRVAAQYDNIFGFQPYYASTASATAKANDVTVKSNTKRILVVGVNAPEDRYRYFGHWLRGFKMPIDGEEFGFINLDGVIPKDVVVNLQKSINVGEYQMFYANATGDAGANRYDERTGEPRLIDLETDINLDDFDVVTLANLPDDSNDYDWFERNFGRSVRYGGRSARQQIEKMVDDVRDYALRGGSVWVSDPIFANALGVIGDIAFVPQIIDAADQGSSNVNYVRSKDERSALINPWRYAFDLNKTFVAADSPEPQPGRPAWPAGTYRDTHGNYLQRVVNTVEGLTDIPGDILTEVIDWAHPYKPGYTAYAEKWVKRPNGLDIGDELWIEGTPFGGGAGRMDWGSGVYEIDERIKGYPAVPLSEVKAGVPVTSFAPRIWEGNTLVNNPYRDHALSIAVRPGDLLNGEVMQGRIFVSFTEGRARAATLTDSSAWDVIPPNEEIANPDWRESEYAREWSNSWWRGSFGGVISFDSTPDTVIIEGDTVTTVPGKPGITTAPEITFRWKKTSNPAPNMAQRGLRWLAADLDEDGNASVGVETATVTTKTGEAAAESQRSTDIAVGTARVITNAYTDADTVVADAEVLVTTPSATVKAEPFIEAVDLSTASITAQSYDDADGVQIGGDWLVLRLPSHTLNLTLEDN